MTSNGSGKYNSTSFQVARLFRKVSEKGNTNFTGRWGGARVLLLKGKEAADDGGEIWSLMLAEAPPTRQQNGSQPPADDAQRNWQRPAEGPNGPKHPGSPANPHWERPQADDAIPF